MSKKTRKLIWSAPLVAVLAVAGALAMFAALGPGSVFANPLPDAAMNLEVEAAVGDAGRTTLVLTWDAPASGNVEGYRIDKSANRQIWETLVMNTESSATTYMDDTLTADDLRWYRVFAVNSHGVSPISNITSGTTSEKTNPGSVRNLTATANGREQIDLSWDPPTDNGGEKIVGYEIQYHNSSFWAAVEDPAAEDSVTSTEETSYEDKFDLDPGDERLYRVRAVSGPLELEASDLGDGDRSKEWERVDGATQMASIPGRVTGLTAVNTGASGDTITLYWYAPEDDGGFDITHYLIQARHDNNAWLDVPDGDELDIEDVNEVTVITGMVGAVAANDAPASVNITVAASNGVPQAAITAHPVDHDDDDTTGDEQVAWDFRVYAITTDNGVVEEATAAGREDDVLRRSASSPEVATATAANREDGNADDGNDIPEHDPLQVPTVGVTGGTGTTPAEDAKEKKIELTITAEEDVPGQDSYRIDYSDDEGETWKLLTRDTSLTDFRNDRVYEDVAGLGYDDNRHYRVFAVGRDWRRDVGPATTIQQGWTKESGAPGKARGVMASSPDLETIMASWTAPEKDGGQPVSTYRYRYVLDDGDGVADASDWTGAASDTPERDIGNGDTGNSNLMVTIDVAEDTHSVQDTEMLTKEKTYWFQVAAVNENPLDDDAERPADWSTAVKFTTGEPTVPNAVEGLLSQHAIDTSGNITGVLLLWNKPSAGAEVDNYAVELLDSQGEWVSPTLDADEVMGRTSYTDPDEPEADEMRTYRVRAENDAGEGPWTMVYHPRDPAADHSHVRTNPSNLMVTVDGTTVSFTWTDGVMAAEGHTVGLVDLSDYSVPHSDVVANGVEMHEYTNVAPGRYMVAVLASPWMAMYYDIEIIEVMSGN